MTRPHRELARSNHPTVIRLRRLRAAIEEFSLPGAGRVARPALWLYICVRSGYFYLKRVLWCEPLFKAYCKQVGRRVRTGVYVHWIQGAGDIIVGDDVIVDGKCTFSFAARFTDHPTLVIGSHTGVGHNCSFTVGKRITIGRNCRIATDAFLFDSPGHPADADARRVNCPPADDEVRPITVEDDVWIGRRAIIFPGVTVGRGSIVSAGAVVMTDVPAYTVVAGNPARRIAALAPAGASEPPAAPAPVAAEPR